MTQLDFAASSATLAAVGEREDRSTEQALARVGSVLRGKWKLDRLLDTGGMASVYAATHRNGSRVAIKLLHSSLSQQEDLRSRFLREGYVANKVGHGSAVSIVDDDETDDGAAFLVMELLEGESLDARLKRDGRVPARESLRIADAVLDVLIAAHGKGIVHRDIKPGNIFLGRDRKVKVLDFGLARVRESSAFQEKQTRDGVVMGTVNYMAPEQARGKTANIDPRTDLFAVGATLFTALTGQHVHEGASAMDRMISAASIPVRSLSVVLPEAHPALIQLVDRALAFERDHRWPNATTMQGAVHNARVHIVSTTSEPPPPPAPVDVNFDPRDSSSSGFSAGLSFIDAVAPPETSISDSMLEEASANRKR